MPAAEPGRQDWRRSPRRWLGGCSRSSSAPVSPPNGCLRATPDSTCWRTAPPQSLDWRSSPHARTSLSGAHFNPAVSLADALIGRRHTGLPLAEVAAYTAVQFVGAIAGALLTDARFDTGTRLHRRRLLVHQLNVLREPLASAASYSTAVSDPARGNSQSVVCPGPLPSSSDLAGCMTSAGRTRNAWLPDSAGRPSPCPTVRSQPASTVASEPRR